MIHVTAGEKALLRQMEQMHEANSDTMWLVRLMGVANVLQFVILIAVTR